MAISFKEFLIEGSIKTPPALTKEITNFIVETYLAYVNVKINKLFSGDDKADAMNLLAHTCQKHKLAVPEDYIGVKLIKAGFKEKELEVDLTDLPERYIEKLKKIGIDVEKFKKEQLLVEFDLDENSKVVNGGQFNPKTMTMSFSAKHLDLLFYDDRKYDLRKLTYTLLDKLENLIGTVNHEMTHLVQHFVLEAFHPKQGETNYTDAELKRNETENYHNSDAEFDPWVKTEAAYIKGIMELLKDIGRPKAFDKSKELAHFTYADGSEPHSERQDGFFTRRSEFFGNLKKKNEENWKKAVKLLTQLVG